MDPNLIYVLLHSLLSNKVIVLLPQLDVINLSIHYKFTARKCKKNYKTLSIPYLCFMERCHR